MLSDIYQPNTQKDLFHKDIANNIRKWIKTLDSQIKQILLLSGPIGCGKSITISILLKGFHVHNIDPSDIRSTDKITEILLPSFHSNTLVNIDKWNHKNFQKKPNIVVIDNIELCEKNIVDMVDHIHNKLNINIPIVLLCNNPKYKDLFINQRFNCTYIECPKPSLLELNKLVVTINDKESLQLTKNNITTIIECSLHDIRQLFYILEQWKTNGTSHQQFDEFITNITVKHTDIDLTDKMLHVFDSSQTYNLNYTFNIVISEPIAISNSIFQNYINVIDSHFHDTNPNDDLAIMDTLASVSQSVSNANMLSTQIFEEQQWDLYNSFAMEGCVKPSYMIKTMFKHKNVNTNNKLVYNSISPFKDMSFNYINSYQEVKKVSMGNMTSSLVNPFGSTALSINNTQFCFYLTSILVNTTTVISSFFESNKKGKNTTNAEKHKLFNSISYDNIKKHFEYLTTVIHYYKLFDVDYQTIHLEKHKFKTEDLLWQASKYIDLRILKRLMNIFSLSNTKECKSLKSHVESAIKFQLLKLVLDDISQISIQKTLSRDITDMQEDLCDIWNF
jgi:DNA polymerase III delta prime subunit